MMGTRSFAKSLGFGAVAALATTPFLLMSRPILGSGNALALGSVLAVSAYLTVVAASRVRGLRVGLAALSAGMLLYVLVEPPSVVLGACVLLAVFRSAFLFRSKPARAFFIEASLLTIGLVLARVLTTGGGTLSVSLAVWGFFLVQSVFCLLGGVSTEALSSSEEDPFERACREAARLMEEEGNGVAVEKA